VYFGGNHFLMQYALTLMALERFEEAVVALNVSVNANEMALFLASSILINQLGNVRLFTLPLQSQPPFTPLFPSLQRTQFVEGFQIAERALEFEGGFMKSRLHQLVGLGYNRMAQKAWDLETRMDLNNKSLDSLKKALALDPQNNETLYLLGMQYADMREASIFLQESQ